MARRLLLIVALALAPASACNKASDDDDSAAVKDDDDSSEAEEEAAAVRVETIERGPIAQVIAASSTVDSDRMATISLETSGVVESIRVEEGDVVAAGAVLATLRNPQLKGEVDRAEAAWRRAKEEYDSVKGLFEQGFVSRNAFDEAALAHDTAKLTFEQAREADAARTLTSPIAGTVSFRDLRFGEAVTAGRPAFTVVDLGALKVEVNLPEKDLARVKVGQAARIRSEVLEGAEVSGSVLRISPVVDAASGTVKVTLRVDPAQTSLRPGMFVAADLVTATHEGALLLSKRALVYEAGAPYAFVVEGETAARRAVELGFTEEDRVEVLEGLAEGDRVVVVGQSILRDGAEVRVAE